MAKYILNKQVKGKKYQYTVTDENATTLKFTFKGSTVTFFPYSGWHTGKTIQDGRGIEKLLKQIRPKRDTPGNP